MDATAAREAELVNQALREAVLLLQRRCEEHGKVERELRQTCENLRRLLIEKTSQLQQEIEKRKAVEEILRSETKARDGERLATWGAIAALFTHEVANSLNGISASLQLLDMKAAHLDFARDVRVQRRLLDGKTTEHREQIGPNLFLNAQQVLLGANSFPGLAAQIV